MDVRAYAAAAAGLVVGLLLVPGVAAAEITGSCTADIAGENVAGLSSSDPADAIDVHWEDVVSASATSASAIDSYQVRLEFAGVDWQVAEGAASGSSWSTSAEIRPYAIYGVGLYKVKGVSAGASPCTGAALINVTGKNPLTTAAGIGGLALAAAGLVTVSAATFRRMRSLGRPGPEVSSIADVDARSSPGRYVKAVETEVSRGSVKGVTQAAKDPQVQSAWRAACKGIRRATFLALSIPLSIATGMVGAGPGAASQSASLPEGRLFPRVASRFHVSVFGTLMAVLGAAGGLVLAQQFALVYPTLITTVVALVAGAAFGLLLTNVGQAVEVRRLNRRLDRAEQTLRRRAASEPAGDVPAAPDTAFAPTHRVPASGLNAYDVPDPDADPAGHLDAGIELELLETRGDWARVRFSNSWIGWVDARNLEVLGR